MLYLFLIEMAPSKPELSHEDSTVEQNRTTVVSLNVYLPVISMSFHFYSGLHCVIIPSAVALRTRLEAAFVTGDNLLCR